MRLKLLQPINPSRNYSDNSSKVVLFALMNSKWYNALEIELIKILYVLWFMFYSENRQQFPVAKGTEFFLFFTLHHQFLPASLKCIYFHAPIYEQVRCMLNHPLWLCKGLNCICITQSKRLRKEIIRISLASDIRYRRYNIITYII